MKKIFGYARVSSQEQVNGTSLDSQIEAIRAHAAMHEYTLVHIFVDAGVSGGLPLSDRPAGRELVGALATGEAQAVTICKLDRGFRSASDCLNNVEAWEKNAIGLCILNLAGTCVDTRTPAGKFMLTVLAAAAEMEKNQINERCSEGRKARKAEGKRIGTVPWGFCLGGDGKTLVPSVREQGVTGICEGWRNDGLSLRQIAAKLNQEGVRTRAGAWTFQQVQRILSRTA
jgi:DNA invertase Pin-like site-specific DNA recombinase